MSWRAGVRGCGLGVLVWILSGCSLFEKREAAPVDAPARTVQKARGQGQAVRQAVASESAELDEIQPVKSETKAAPPPKAANRAPDRAPDEPDLPKPTPANDAPPTPPAKVAPKGSNNAANNTGVKQA